MITKLKSKTNKNNSINKILYSLIFNILGFKICIYDFQLN